MSEFVIRAGTASDIPGILQLIEEFAEFEKLSDSCQISEADLLKSLFGADKFAGCLIAEIETRPVGYAIFFPVFKTFRGERSMYLEDLYVSPAMRGRGLGLAMLKAVAREAQRQNCVRMDWQALKWNTPAIKFYQNLAAEPDDENLDFRLRGAAFRSLCQPE